MHFHVICQLNTAIKNVFWKRELCYTACVVTMIFAARISLKSNFPSIISVHKYAAFLSTPLKLPLPNCVTHFSPSHLLLQSTNHYHTSFSKLCHSLRFLAVLLHDANSCVVDQFCVIMFMCKLSSLHKS